MEYADIRRLSLKVFLGFLSLTALIAIASVLTDEFAEIQEKILGTTLTITGASICSMSCAAFIEKRKLALPGLCGIVLAVCAAVLLIAGIWPDIESSCYWRTTISFVVLAIAFAHALLLWLPELDKRQRWIQTVSSTSIGLLALLLVILIVRDLEHEVYDRILAVVAIFVALETLAVPILVRLRKATGPGGKKLVLQMVREGLYSDAQGRTYQVLETGNKHRNVRDRQSANVSARPVT